MPATMNFISRYKDILEMQRPGRNYGSASIPGLGRGPGGGGNRPSTVKEAVWTDVGLLEQDTEAYHYPALQHDYPYYGGNPEHHREQNTPPHKKKSVLRKVAIGLGLAAAAGGTYAGIKHRAAIGRAADIIKKHGAKAAYNHLRYGVPPPPTGAKGATSTNPIDIAKHAAATAKHHIARSTAAEKENIIPNKNSAKSFTPKKGTAKLSSKRNTKSKLKMAKPNSKASKVAPK